MEDESLTDLSSQACTHYMRRCALVCPCCVKIYNCRHCHDEAEVDHKLARETVNKIKCRQCDTIQDVRPRCVSCDIKFGLYYCGICRMFDDRDRGLFHCVQCGLCRVGGRQNFTHCSLCDICFRTGTQHKCIEKCARTDCPICLEDLHSSQDACQKLSCGHMMHTTCFGQMRNYRNSCPLCLGLM